MGTRQWFRFMERGEVQGNGALIRTLNQIWQRS